MVWRPGALVDLGRGRSHTKSKSVVLDVPRRLQRQRGRAPAGTATVRDIGRLGRRRHRSTTAWCPRAGSAASVATCLSGSTTATPWALFELYSWGRGRWCGPDRPRRSRSRASRAGACPRRRGRRRACRCPGHRLRRRGSGPSASTSSPGCRPRRRCRSGRAGRGRGRTRGRRPRCRRSRAARCSQPPRCRWCRSACRRRGWARRRGSALAGALEGLPAVAPDGVLAVDRVAVGLVAAGVDDLEAVDVAVGLVEVAVAVEVVAVPDVELRHGPLDLRVGLAGGLLVGDPLRSCRPRRGPRCCCRRCRRTGSRCCGRSGPRCRGPSRSR